MTHCIRIAVALLLSASVAHAGALKTPDVKPACPAGALGTSRTLVVGTKGGSEIGLESYPRTLPLADHEVVLTFDDGPGPTTPLVLAALAHECVKATFFLVGRNAEAEPELVKRELAEGHTLGHHTFSHPAATLRRMTPAAGEADIERGFRADDIAAYGAAGDDPRVPFFRFPGFADTKETDAWLAQRNIAVFGTDIWALDWLMLTPQYELTYLMRRLDEAKKGIILLHDTRPSTAEMLPAFLRELKAKGYHVVALVPGPGVAETVDAQKGWTSETDRIIDEVFATEDHTGPRHRRFARAYVAVGWHAGRRARRKIAAAQHPSIYRGFRLAPHHARFGAAKRTRTSTGLPTSTSS